MQRSEAGFGLVDPKEPGADAALMHYSIEVVLQPKKIERVTAKVVDIIVVHPGPLELETDRAADPAGLSVNDDPLICNVIMQSLFGGQVIGIFVESPKEIFVELVNVDSARVFQRRIWPLRGQSIGDHSAVSSDGFESGLLKRGSDAFIGRLGEVTGYYIAWNVRMT